MHVNNTTLVQMPESIELLLRHRAINHLFGLVDHWFIEIKSMDLEIHMGNYHPSTHLPAGTTQGAHTYAQIFMCPSCINTIVKTTIDLREIFYYPFINCETLVNKHFCEVAISTQTVLITIAAISAILAICKPFFIYVLLIIVIIYFAYSKYTYSHTCIQKCVHIVDSPDIYPVEI
jgi:hypothetical protein